MAFASARARRWIGVALAGGVALLAPATTTHADEAGQAEGPLAGAKYAAAQKFVATYCASCHSESGTSPLKKRALPQMQLDTYQSWSTHQSVLRGVLDKWHPDGKVMPPPSAKRHPTDAERHTILDWLARGSPNTPDGK